jgi:hypothetical protein
MRNLDFKDPPLVERS